MKMDDALSVDTSNRRAANASSSPARVEHTRKAPIHGKRKVSQSERVLRVAHALQTQKGLTAKKLARLTGASRRTIFRDLSLLSSNGIGLSFDKSTRAYKPGNDQLPFGRFTCEEVDALVLGIEAVVQGHLGLDPETARLARDKFLAMLPDGIQQRWKQLAGRIFIRGKPASEPLASDVLTVIQSCLLRGKQIEIECDGQQANGVAGLLWPCSLIHEDGAWNVLVSSDGRTVTGCIQLHAIVGCRVRENSEAKSLVDVSRFLSG